MKRCYFCYQEMKLSNGHRCYNCPETVSHYFTDDGTLVRLAFECSIKFNEGVRHYGVYFNFPDSCFIIKLEYDDYEGNRRGRKALVLKSMPNLTPANASEKLKMILLMS